MNYYSMEKDASNIDMKILKNCIKNINNNILSIEILGWDDKDMICNIYVEFKPGIRWIVPRKITYLEYDQEFQKQREQKLKKILNGKV